MVDEKIDAVHLRGEIAFHNKRTAAYEAELRRVGRFVESAGRSIQGFHLGIDWGTLQDSVTRAQLLLSQYAGEIIASAEKGQLLAEDEGQAKGQS